MRSLIVYFFCLLLGKERKVIKPPKITIPIVEQSGRSIMLQGWISMSRSGNLVHWEQSWRNQNMRWFWNQLPNFVWVVVFFPNMTLWLKAKLHIWLRPTFKSPRSPDFNLIERWTENQDSTRRVSKPGELERFSNEESARVPQRVIPLTCWKLYWMIYSCSSANRIHNWWLAARGKYNNFYIGIFLSFVN